MKKTSVKLTALVLALVLSLALALTGCGSLAGRDCGACCKGVGFSGSAAHAWEGSK